MKKFNAFLVSVLATAALNAAVIEQVIVRQQWPWSTDVKVEYKLSGVTKPVDLAVKAYNGDVELPLPTTAVKGERYGISEDGVGTIVIDPVAAFGTEKVALANFKVKLSVSDSSENINEILYKIFSLTNSSEAVVNVTRADLFNGKYGSYVTDFSSLGAGFSSPAADVMIWTGVTNNPAYKDTHLVMRKIPAKGEAFLMGSPSDEVGREFWSADAGTETQVSVRLTNDYYMAVFELTQAQYRHVFNSSPSNYTGDDADCHPVEKVTYDTLRGSTSQVGPSGEKINWPTNSHPHEVYSGSFLAALRSATGNVCEFDLPTSAQWEYACRAKTLTSINNGLNVVSAARYDSAELDSVAWFANIEQAVSANTTYPVGCKAPNAWGLYDMHGNVNEFCLGGYQANSNPEGLAELVDPPGSIIVPNGNCTFRGGGARSQSWLCRSAAHSFQQMQIWHGNSNSYLGVRLAFQAECGE